MFFKWFVFSVRCFNLDHLCVWMVQIRSTLFLFLKNIKPLSIARHVRLLMKVKLWYLPQVLRVPLRDLFASWFRVWCEVNLEVKARPMPLISPSLSYPPRNLFYIPHYAKGENLDNASVKPLVPSSHIHFLWGYEAFWCRLDYWAPCLKVYSRRPKAHKP